MLQVMHTYYHKNIFMRERSQKFEQKQDKLLVIVVTMLAISNALNLKSFAYPSPALNPRCAVAMFVAIAVSLLISN